MNLEALIASFLAITFAELGDKTQLVTLIYALKTGKFVKVLIVSIIALALVTIISILIGYSLNVFLSKWVKYISSLLFIITGLYFLKTSGEVEYKEISSLKDLYNQFTLVFSAEFGDKTQLLCISLMTKFNDAIAVYLGAILGFLIVNAIAILLSKLFRRKVEKRMKLINKITGLVFLVFGLISLIL